MLIASLEQERNAATTVRALVALMLADLQRYSGAGRELAALAEALSADDTPSAEGNANRLG